MKPFLFILTVLFSSFLLNAQDSIQTAPIDEDKILIPLFVDDVPRFPDGDEAYKLWLDENLSLPDSMKGSLIKGHVKVNFVVEKNGTISNIDVWYNSYCPGCESIVIETFEKSPAWISATRDGKPVRCKLSQELTFFEKHSKKR